MPKKRKEVFLGYHSQVSHVIANFGDWESYAKHIMCTMNSSLGNSFPESFYFLRYVIKGKSSFLAHKLDEEGILNDPEIIHRLKLEEQPNAHTRWDP